MSHEPKPAVSLPRQMFARIDALTLKERVLISTSLLLSITMSWHALLFEPLDVRRRALTEEIGRSADSLQRLEAVSDELIAGAHVDPDAGARQLLAARDQELKALAQSVEAKVGRVVPPAQMAAVLETVLGRFRELEFLGLEGLGVEPLVEPVTVTAEAAQPVLPVGDQPGPARELVVTAAGQGPRTAYRHGIRIRFAGSYLATIAYLQALEALPWGFFWDRVELETQDFPRVEGSIVVYTVSLEEGWIGV